mmetsp:Transcript_108324/g.170839  ORF Transcript_108324/g.170839 Transcript_108324/m.170839 type:complete len:675 (+) Transcript_108324:92-2116(+)
MDYIQVSPPLLANDYNDRLNHYCHYHEGATTTSTEDAFDMKAAELFHGISGQVPESKQFCDDLRFRFPTSRKPRIGREHCPSNEELLQRISATQILLSDLRHDPRKFSPNTVIGTPTQCAIDEFHCRTPPSADENEFDLKLTLPETLLPIEFGVPDFPCSEKALEEPWSPLQSTRASECSQGRSSGSREDSNKEPTSSIESKAFAELISPLVKYAMPFRSEPLVSCIIDGLRDDVELVHAPTSSSSSTQSLTHDRIAREWEVPLEGSTPPQVHKPKTIVRHRDVLEDAKAVKDVDASHSLDNAHFLLQGRHLKSRNPTVVLTCDIPSSPDIVHLDGNDIDRIASEALHDAECVDVDRLTGAEVEEIVGAVLVNARSQRSEHKVCGTLAEVAVTDCGCALTNPSCECSPIDVGLMPSETPTHPSLQEDDSSAHLLIPCRRARACKPPVSSPGPGPATQGSSQGNAISRGGSKKSTIPKQKVHWGTVALMDDINDEPQDVFLQIYNFNSITGSLGLSIFHVGVEVYGCEVWYGASGVRKCLPKSLDPKAYVRSVFAGQTKLSLEQVCSLVEDLESEWSGERYRLLDFNCQTFASEFCKLLGLRDSVPHEYVRHGDVADWALRSFVSAIRPTSPKLTPEAAQSFRTADVQALMGACGTERRIKHLEKDSDTLTLYEI